MYYFLYPNKDTYIYEVDTNSEKNFGSDNNLVLKKDFDGNTLNGKIQMTVDQGCDSISR